MTGNYDKAREGRLLQGLALAAVLGALWWLAWMFLLWWRWHPQLPWRDVFVILDDLRPLLQGAGIREWLAFLVEPHYAAHRIALPRLLVAADLEYFGARNLLLYVTGWVGLLLLWLLPLRMARRELGRGTSGWWFLAGITGMLLLAPAQLWNLANGINSSWHLSLALALLALVLLASTERAPSPRQWLLAYLLATLSAFTTFSGVILWLLLPLFALGGDRRVLVITLLCSVLLTVAYLQGIASDAGVATRWEAEDPEIARQARELGAAALAANTPWQVVQKALTVLGWPLAAAWPGAAPAIAALSLLLPLALAWRAGRDLLAGKGLPSPWIRLCLAVAALTVGTALAIQLGRVIEQPNYAHGPSYERYSTVVALYWCSVTGMLLACLQRRPALHKASAMLAALALAWMLLAPGGDYLQQEMESLETAARLYAAGEKPELRAGKGRTPSRFKPSYVYSFDDLLQQRQAAYTRPPQLPATTGYGVTCTEAGIEFRATPAQRRDLIQLEARVSTPLHYLVRDILLADGQHLLARLVPVYGGAASALSLAGPQDTLWRGRLASASAQAQAPRLVFTLPMGMRKQCGLAIANLAPVPGQVE